MSIELYVQIGPFLELYRSFLLQQDEKEVHDFVIGKFICPVLYTDKDLWQILAANRGTGVANMFGTQHPVNRKWHIRDAERDAEWKTLSLSTSLVTLSTFMLLPNLNRVLLSPCQSLLKCHCRCHHLPMWGYIITCVRMVSNNRSTKRFFGVSFWRNPNERKENMAIVFTCCSGGPNMSHDSSVNPVSVFPTTPYQDF